MTVYLVLFGAAFGLGIALIARWAFPPTPTLAEALDSLRRPPAAPAILGADATSWATKVGAPMAGWLAAANLPGAKVAKDLTVLERAPQRHLAEKAVLAVFGFVFAPVMWTVLAALGMQLPWVVPVWGALGLAAAGFYLPDLAVKAEANARRDEFRHALTAYLDLVVISLSGGAGVEAALAGSEGAKVRASLASKAQGLRAQALADADAASQQATERMSLPVICMFAGFMLFIAYPAMSHAMSVL